MNTGIKLGIIGVKRKGVVWVEVLEEADIGLAIKPIDQKYWPVAKQRLLSFKGGYFKEARGGNLVAKTSLRSLLGSLINNGIATL